MGQLSGSRDLLLTGHEDGSVCVWAAGDVSLRLIYRSDGRASAPKHGTPRWSATPLRSAALFVSVLQVELQLSAAVRCTIVSHQQDKLVVADQFVSQRGGDGVRAPLMSVSQRR